MERLNDKNTRLFYGTFTHAEYHTSTLPEFREIRNLTTHYNLDALYRKIVAFQNKRTESLPLTEREWEVCQKLVDAEIVLLRRLAEEEKLPESRQKYLDSADDFAKSKDILEAAYKASLELKIAQMEER